MHGDGPDVAARLELQAELLQEPGQAEHSERLAELLPDAPPLSNLQ